MAMFTSSEISLVNIAPSDTGDFLVLQDNMPMWYLMSQSQQIQLRRFVHDCSRNCFSGIYQQDFADLANWVANAYLNAVKTREFSGAFVPFLRSGLIQISVPLQMPIGKFMAL